METYNLEPGFCPDDMDDAGDSYPNVSTLELLYRYGYVRAEERKPSRPRQCPIKQASLVDQAGSAAVSMRDAESEAGASAQKKIAQVRRQIAAEGATKDKKTMSRICAAQRAGLIRALQVLEHTDDITELNDRVTATVDIVLDLSANLAVLNDTGWAEAFDWIGGQMTMFTVRNTDWMEQRFRTHLKAAEAQLARNVPSCLSDYRTAASPHDIAHRIGLTTHAMRVARANKCGLTSIDPEPKKERDRRNADKMRRSRGQKLRSECTKTADDRILAIELDCGASTLRRHRKAGTLETFIAERRAMMAKRQDEQNASRC